MIIYKQGDLLLGPEKYIVHGCNAQGGMGTGIALQIKQKYPEVFDVYRSAYEEHNQLFLGDTIPAVAEDGKVVFNCITQDRYGRNKSIVYVDYDAVRKCLIEVNNTIRDNNSIRLNHHTEVAMPKIGCGLANGDWAVVEAIINEVMIDCQPIVYTL